MAKYKFENFGVMIDCSRNAVMSVDALKRYFTLLKKMGYNCVMLYTEDTYEVDGEPYFGYMRGRYSKAEMKELDAFAASLGMSLIPCVQTLAHFDAAVRWETLPVDYGNILLTDDERTYEFIDHMFATLSECFASKKIHVGMDEAWLLGRGKHLDIHGYEPVDVIIKRHLARVMEIAKKYDYELMIWSDMFFRGWNGGKYYAPKTEIPKEYVEAFPESIIPVYWDYYSCDKQRYSDMLYNHSQLSNKTWFAGGAWSWRGFAPSNEFTLKSMIPALDACKEHKVKNVVMTMWGDNGGECSHFAQIPSLFYLSQYAKGVTDETVIKAKFKSLTGIDFDDFMKIDNANDLKGNEKGTDVNLPQCPSKYMLYSDTFNSFMDTATVSGGSEKYIKHAAELHAIAKTSRKYGYLFDTQAKLCDVLAIKYELGKNVRTAYAKGDKEELRRLAEEDYAKVIKLVDVFARAFEKQWFIENKTCGFDVQDIRIGGLIRRLDACRRRLLDYSKGNIGRIEELEGELLPVLPGKPVGESITFPAYHLIATANRF